MLLVTDLAAVDHHSCTVTLIANALVHPQLTAEELDAAFDDAQSRLDAMQNDLARPSESTVVPSVPVPPKPARSRTPPGEYEAAVERCLEAIRAGEVFQILPGQRFIAETTAAAFDVYRALRTLNPSPYLYYLHFADFDIVGSSPEALVTVSDGSATIHPIAGTRPRGSDRGRRRRPGRRAAGRSEGAGRAPDAGGSGPQRPRPGLHAGLGAGGRVRRGGALQPRLAHRLHRLRGGGGRPGRLRRLHRRLSARHGVRRAEGAGDAAAGGDRAGSPGHLRRRGRLLRSGRRHGPGHRDPDRGDDPGRGLRAGRRPAWSPIRCRPTRRPRPGTRPGRCCRPSPPPRRWWYRT